MRFCYADPPYPGHTKRGLYKADPRCAEVDHAELIAGLVRDYPDGWALSTSSPALFDVLSLCPRDVRVMPWVKPFCAYKPNVNPAYAWEPVIVHGGRTRHRGQLTVRDWVSANIMLKRGCAGAKPPDFCSWLFSVFNARGGDTLVDLFPGSGAVGEAWAAWQAAAEPRWLEVGKCDARAASVADRHYSRQTRGDQQFLPPGETLALLHEDPDGRAVWGVCHNLSPRGGRRWRCTIFRNESRALSSELIRRATVLTYESWLQRPGGLPAAPLTTEVDAAEVRAKRDPGRCFRLAGWRHVRTTPAGHGRSAKLVFEAPLYAAQERRLAA